MANKDPMIYEPVASYDGPYDYEKWNECRDENFKHLKEIEKKAIVDGGLLYRFLYEAVADGQAIYQIVKVNKRTVRVRLCDIDGYADYVVPQWGEEATVPITYATSGIKWQDLWRERRAEMEVK